MSIHTGYYKNLSTLGLKRLHLQYKATKKHPTREQAIRTILIERGEIKQ